MNASELFDQAYFNGGGKVGGYARTGYADFPVHHFTAALIADLKPTSVLEIGCARGYVLQRLEAQGIPCRGLEVSRHCYLTRATNAVQTWDLTETPWPLEDQSVDLAYSVAVLEHIPEEKVPAVLGELARVAKRGLHGVDLHDDDHFDKTHFTIKPLEWWLERMPPGHVPVDKEQLEAGSVTVPSGSGIKVNAGCHSVQFHHGWINTDILDLSDWSRANGYRFTRHDLTRGLWFDDGVVDIIYASHVLEHFPHAQGLAVLKEFHRVLKPGGICRIIVPDAAKLTKMAIDGTLGQFDEVSPTAAAHSSQAGKLYELLAGGDHRAFYDETALGQAMIAAGFSTGCFPPPFHSQSQTMQRETWDMFPDLSLIAEGVK